MNLIILPELKKLIPQLQREELEQLEQNVLRDGIRDPLVIWDRSGDQILIDGHNRYSIAQKNNLNFKTKVEKFDDIENAKLWIEENQYGRRNLSDDQKKVIVESIAERREAIARKEAAIKAAKTTTQTIKNQRDSVVHPVVHDAKPKQTNTLRATAKEFKVSQKGVQTVRKLKEKVPELIEKVRAGELSLSAVKKQVLNKEKAERQKEAPKVVNFSSSVKAADAFSIVLQTKIKKLPGELTLPLAFGMKVALRELAKTLRSISKLSNAIAEDLLEALEEKKAA